MARRSSPIQVMRNRRFFWMLFGILFLLVGLPLAGVWLAGKPLSRYAEFPPQTRYVEPAPFSWPIFVTMGALVLLVVIPFLVRMWKGRNELEKVSPVGTFPWWGWPGLVFGLCAWVLAWSRFPWFAQWQPYTFSLLWFPYIVVINALTYRRSGYCMLVDRSRYFLRLFPLSAAFWWFFEYLNRFVQNWHYVGLGTLGPFDYFIFATLPFSTVLPAVLGTEEFLATFPRLTVGVTHFLPIKPNHPGILAGGVLLLSCLSLTGLGVWPNLLFPVLWLAPLFLLVAIQIFLREPTVFRGVPRGDWSEIVRLALAALICGFFWEMWNYRSLAKWIYQIPYVGRFYLFEMPALGYAGYLPFGLECATVARMFLGDHAKENLNSATRTSPDFHSPRVV